MGRYCPRRIPDFQNDIFYLVLGESFLNLTFSCFILCRGSSRINQDSVYIHYTQKWHITTFRHKKSATNLKPWNLPQIVCYSIRSGQKSNFTPTASSKWTTALMTSSFKEINQVYSKNPFLLTIRILKKRWKTQL